MNGVGKPCAGERHARFERGPLGSGITDVAEMSEKPSGQRLQVTSRIAKPAAYLTQRTTS